MSDNDVDFRWTTLSSEARVKFIVDWLIEGHDVLPDKAQKIARRVAPMLPLIFDGRLTLQRDQFGREFIRMATHNHPLQE